MKQIPLVLSVISHLIFQLNSFAQGNLIRPEDFDYYYMLDNSIMDVRTHKAVINNPKFELPAIDNDVVKYHEKEQILSIWKGSTINNYDVKGNPISSFSVWGCALSRDWRKLLYNKENDLWVGTIDYKTGKIFNEKRLTKLGIIKNIHYINWYGDNILCEFGRKNYQINIENISISESELPFESLNALHLQQKGNFIFGSQNIYSKNFLSPSGRYYLILSNEQPDYIFDMQNMTKKNLKNDITMHKDYNCSWISDTIAIVYSGGKNDLEHKDFVNQYFWVSLNSGDAKILPPSQFDLDVDLEKHLSFYFRNQTSKSISTDNKYMLVPLRLSYENKNKPNLLIYNFNNIHDIINPEINLQLFRMATNRQYYEWISEKIFVFKQQGDITTQGTWIYNISTKEKKQLTPFLVEDVILLPKARKVVFIANKYLFCMDANGGNLEQVSNNQVALGRLRTFKY